MEFTVAPQSGYSSTEFRNVDFYGGRKTLEARERINNKLNSHMTPTPGIEPGSQW
jgi:hypothetical protein